MAHPPILRAIAAAKKKNDRIVAGKIADRLRCDFLSERYMTEIGDVSRFQSVKQAISYCGLCSAERSSADKLVRMPISKQRNKHIQQTLVEAAKLAPRYSHGLALVYERERQRGNKNRATLAVAEDGRRHARSGAQKAGLRAYGKIQPHCR